MECSQNFTSYIDNINAVCGQNIIQVMDGCQRDCMLVIVMVLQSCLEDLIKIRFDKQLENIVDFCFNKNYPHPSERGAGH